MDLQRNPYAGVDWDAATQHKAQLHAHTWHPPPGHHSGSDPPEVVVDDYRAAGYSVLALTEHEYNVEAATWPWTDFGRDPAALGMVAVPGMELSVDLGVDEAGDEAVGEGVEHDLLAYFCDLADTDGMSFHDVLAEVGERGGLAVVPHPSRYHDDGAWYEEYVRAHPRLLGVEVVNAADRYPTDRDVWDDLLERLGGERAVWGFSNDDYHGREREYAFDRSRNVLILEEPTEVAVREALVEGRFLYQHVVEADQETVDGRPVVASEPPAVQAIRHDLDRGELVVEARDYEEIQWASEGAVIERGPALAYRDAEDLGCYARARLVSESGSETGTQPFLFG